MQISTWSRTDQVCDAKTTHGRNTRRRAKTHRRETRHNHCHAGPKTHARPRALTERAQRQTLGHCHDQRDLDNTAGRTVENKRGTHLGMDGKQQRMPWLSMTHPPEMEQIRQRSTTLWTKTHRSDHRGKKTDCRTSQSTTHTGIWRRTRTTIDLCLPMRVLQLLVDSMPYCSSFALSWALKSPSTSTAKQQRTVYQI